MKKIAVLEIVCYGTVGFGFSVPRDTFQVILVISPFSIYNCQLSYLYDVDILLINTRIDGRMDGQDLISQSLNNNNNKTSICK